MKYIRNYKENKETINEIVLILQPILLCVKWVV
jgi:hypothetical protein